MTAYVALLRAVNVGGTGVLAMAELRSLCLAAGLQDVRTHIASGNVLFNSGQPESAVKALLEAGLQAHFGSPVGVMVRTAAEIAEVAAGNPFPNAPGSQVAAIFLDGPCPADLLEEVTAGVDGEEIRPGRREIYVWYPRGMGRSKLRIPAARQGTARNMNTVARLAALAGL